MANAKIFRALPLAGASADVTEAGFAPANFMNDYAGVVWQSPAAGAAHFVQVDLGADVAFDTAALFGIANCPPGATMTVNIATDAQGPTFPGGSWTGGALPLRAGVTDLVNGKAVALWQAPAVAPPPAAARHIRFGFNGLADAALQVARVAVGQCLVLNRNYAFGGAHGIRDYSTVGFSARGNLLRRRGKKMRAIGLSFPAVKQDEVEAQVQPLIELAGLDSPVVLIRDPADNAMRQRRMYFGLLEGDLGMIHRAASGWEWRCNLVSLF